MNRGPSRHFELKLLPDFNSKKGLRFDFPDPPPCCEAKPAVPHDFSGPYKEQNPPGTRTPAVREKEWGDVPYLPSYQDPMYQKREPVCGQPDNLLTRGPFYRGASETHEEYFARDLPPKREYHKFVRHYHEPGMKYDKSITQTDFTPPMPMTPKDKSPCLQEEDAKSWYEPKPTAAKNPHAKEHEVRTREPKMAYFDDPPEHVFETEYGDNFACYHAPKEGDKMKDIEPVPGEIFLTQARRAHAKCNHSPPKANFWDPSCGKESKIKSSPCKGSVEKKPWLLCGKNYSFCNGVLLLPCEHKEKEG